MHPSHATTLKQKPRIAGRLREAGVMGDDDNHRTACRFLAHDPKQIRDALRVESGRGFIEKKQQRPMHERPRESDALPLTARVRSERPFAKGSQTKARARRFISRRRGDPVENRGELNVLST
jgi:hypothetical protein